MIMQTITPSRTYTDNAGRNYSIPPDNQVPAPANQVQGTTYPSTKVNLDNYTQTIGAQLQTFTDGLTGAYTDARGNQLYQWSQYYGDAPMTLTTADAPFQPLPANASQMSINQESATTYLMYMPSGGVWTAIASVQWSWSATVSAQGGWMPTGQANPATPAPVGDPWPEWAGLTSNIGAGPGGGWVGS